MRRILATGAAAAALIVGATAATEPVHVIQGDRSVGGILIARSTPADVESLFGPPKRSRKTSVYDCIETRPRLGLVVRFLDLSQRRPCTVGVASVVTVTSRRAWRTLVGLRVGDAVARVRRLYPRATFHSGSFAAWNGWWLVTRRACKEVGGSPYPGLLARVRGGRVTAIVAATSACE